MSKASRARQETRLFAPSAHNAKSVSRLGELFSKSSERDMALDMEPEALRQKMQGLQTKEKEKSHELQVAQKQKESTRHQETVRERSKEVEQEAQREATCQQDLGRGY